MVEANRSSVCEDFEEQRCIIEGQQVEIRRQQHRIEMQRRRLDYVDAELAAIKTTLQPTRRDLRSLERCEGWPPGAESLNEAAVVDGASVQDSRSDFVRVVVRIGDRWRPTDNPYVAARVTTERIEIGVHTSQCYHLIGVLGIARRARWRKMRRVAATNPSPRVAVHRGSPVRRRDRIFGTKRAGSRRRAPAVHGRVASAGAAAG
jgi:hypothetical protein